ncbi:OLC1v1025084C1 [Oldenlandia corymbosa var. corymbosa]|uniref:OLC1v1025084C1 n=1 Tax=Oldenlandia corymbosa var. corymbosa TaxID=529605 RepID=A0AAV1C5B1_OLDCO|nr:OLC1v1025084C1 [Oldenlandia corymbosa var. corymbosa]
MKAELGRNTPGIPLQNHSLFSGPQSSILSGALKGCLGSLDGACIEKLLLHCASALENNDVTLAQQVMWVLNNVASPVGDPNQRLAWWFLRALISRVGSLCPTSMNLNRSSITSPAQRRLMTVTELAGYVDLIPWHRFGFCASNSAISKAIQGYNKVHIIDFSVTHCMQWPTLIDALAKRSEGPPSVRISVPSWRPQVPPLLNVTSEEVGQRLGNFAKFKDVPFEFHVFGEEDQTLSFSSSSPCNSHFDLLLNQLNPSMLNLKEDEALVINCQNWIRYLPMNEGSVLPDSHEIISCRDIFFDTIKGLNPCIITVVDEDSDLGALSLTSRITTCFNYLWIPFDALETFLSKDNTQRIEYEADIGHKIENIIAFEGTQRIERLESGIKFSQRMQNNGFSSVPFGEDTISEVKFLLDEHASGWGMKKEDDMLVLTWKALVDMYAKCKALEDAKTLFDRMADRDLVTWTVMIGAHTECVTANEAIELFERMLEEGVSPDNVAVVNIVNACAKLGAMHKARLVHDYILSKKLSFSVVLGTTMIDMYAKCGSVDEARRIFDQMRVKNAVTWSAMIAACGYHGRGKEALELFSMMLSTGVQPNSITLVSLLYSCSHSGMVEDGLKLFSSMHQDFGVSPDVKHITCMVDLLGRAGKLDEALNLIENMSIKRMKGFGELSLGHVEYMAMLNLQKRQLDLFLNCNLKTLATTYYSLIYTPEQASGKMFLGLEVT